MSSHQKVLFALIVLGFGIVGAFALRKVEPNALEAAKLPVATFPWESTGYAEVPSSEPYLQDESQLAITPALSSKAEVRGPQTRSFAAIVPLADHSQSLPPRPSFQIDPVVHTQPMIPETSAPETIEHLVRDGDTPESIALRYLGDASRFDEIYQENRHVLRHPRKLIIHAKLRIPGRLQTDDRVSPAPQPQIPEGRTTLKPTSEAEAWQ